MGLWGYLSTGGVNAIGVVQLNQTICQPAVVVPPNPPPINQTNNQTTIESNTGSMLPSLAKIVITALVSIGALMLVWNCLIGLFLFLFLCW